MSESNDQRTEGGNPGEVLEPSVAHRVQIIGTGDYEFTCVQKPLSFIGKLDVFSVLGRALDKALGGPDGISIADLLEVPERSAGGITTEDLKDADMFIKGISKILMYAPEIYADLCCVLLAVPKGEREVIKAIMSYPEAEGGLNDEDGIAILETFVDQNWEVIADFFSKRIGPLLAKIGEKVAPASQSSKPSKTSPQRTGGRSKK